MASNAFTCHLPASLTPQGDKPGSSGESRLERLYGKLWQPLSLRVHVVDGEIKYVETDNTETMIYDGLRGSRLPARWVLCVVASIADRLKYPMKRVGARAAG